MQSMIQDVREWLTALATRNSQSSAKIAAAIRRAYREGYDNALAEQPFDRRAIIEQCARRLEQLGAHSYQGHDLPAAIRALKNDPHS